MKHKFHCLPDCSWCCGGQIHFPQEVYEKHKFKRQREVLLEVEYPDKQTIQAFTLDGSCVFVSPQNKCVIYKDRPMVCRTFGELVQYPCPFVRPDGTPRPKEEVDELMKKLNITINFAREVYHI